LRVSPAFLIDAERAFFTNTLDKTLDALIDKHQWPTNEPPVQLRAGYEFSLAHHLLVLMRKNKELRERLEDTEADLAAAQERIEELEPAAEPDEQPAEQANEQPDEEDAMT
jgi:hypothetical protein